MNFLAVLLLGFIAVQLFQINLSKKMELSLREEEKEEEKIRENMPHVFKKSMTDEVKNEVIEFYQNRFGNQQHLRFITQMKEIADIEQDEDRKKYMHAALARMSDTHKILNERLNNREATHLETLYVLWKYYRSESDSFPRESATVSPTDKLQIEWYLALFPEKVVCKNDK